MNGTFGVDGFDPLRHGFDFWFSNFSIEGMELAIHIADADFVQIDQRDGAKTGASQRFNRPGTHATNADDADMRLTKTLQTLD